jgi:serine/threonine-protein kinase HipA
MADYATARVFLEDTFVGALAESHTGEVVFEFDEEFRTTGPNISPIHLPSDRTGPVTFPELRRKPAFEGLPGAFADALPDAFGNAIIRRYFEQRGRPQAAMSPVQKLLYVGERAMGALVFRPAAERGRGDEEVLEVRALVEQARRVIEGDTSSAIPEMMQVGSTVGGARAKALLLWDRARNLVRSGHAAPRPGEEHWIIKFDGVTGESGGQQLRAARHPTPWCRCEFAYSQMARDAGIRISETSLLHDGELAHFMTRRFDRVAISAALPNGAPHDPYTGGGAGNPRFRRIHMHSLGGMLHLDYNDQYTFSYEGYFDTIRLLGLGQSEIEEAFRRMVFSVATINFDDHLKNFSFLMDSAGNWRLSPAYDVSYAENNAWTRQHQMSVNGKFANIARSDLAETASKFDIPAGGAAIIDQVTESLAGWPRYSATAGVPAEFSSFLEKRFERLRS